MRQRVSAPDAEALCGLFAERALGVYLGGIGAGEGDGEVEDGPALQDEADASEDAIHFPVGTETIAVDQWKALGLLDQFLVGHEPPARFFVSTLRLSCVGDLTQSKTILGHNHRYLRTVETRKVHCNSTSSAQGVSA